LTVGVELKASYYGQATRNLEAALAQQGRVQGAAA
jgi:hypothetical protein